MVFSDSIVIVPGASEQDIFYSTDKGVTWKKSSQLSESWNTPVSLSDGTVVATSASDENPIYSLGILQLSVAAKIARLENRILKLEEKV